MTTDIVPALGGTPTRAIPAELRDFLLETIDHAAATARLAIEAGVSIQNLARKSALVTLAGLQEEGKPVVLITTETEEVLRQIVDTVRSPMVVRYKLVERPVAQPALPAPADSPAAPGEPAAIPNSQSSESEEGAEA